MSSEEPSLPPMPPYTPSFWLSGLARGVFFYTGVLLPVTCFLIGFPEQPDEQVGTVSEYAQLLLSHRGSLPFYPLLFYNIVSMTLLVYHPHRFAQNACVRFGIYSGVVVAIGFLGIFCALWPFSWKNHFWENYLFWAILGTILPGCLFYFSSKSEWVKMFAYFFILICVFLFPISIAISIAFSTSWAVASYATMSCMILRQQKEHRFQFTLAELLGVVTWFAIYCATWRVAYLNVLEINSNLPKHLSFG
jgi:hypothetical protein